MDPYFASEKDFNTYFIHSVYEIKKNFNYPNVIINVNNTPRHNGNYDVNVTFFTFI